MPSTPRQYNQPMGVGRCCNHDICKSRGQAPASSQIGQPSGNTSGRNVEGKYSIVVEMEQSLEPGYQVDRLTFGFFSTRLGNSILDLCHSHHRQIDSAFESPVEYRSPRSSVDARQAEAGNARYAGLRKRGSGAEPSQAWMRSPWRLPRRSAERALCPFTFTSFQRVNNFALAS
jgi:hypothetical protein